MYKLSDYIVITEALDNENIQDPSKILFAARTGESVLIKESLYQKLQAGDFSDIEDSILIHLMELEAIVPAREDEFQEILQRNLVHLKDTKNLGIVIQPTANCQLGCHYCGQVHVKKTANRSLTQKMVDRVIHKLQKNERYQSLSVQWYGGEPLMAFQSILEISRSLIAYCDSHKIEYDAHMITNGLSFKPKIFERLAQQKITGYQITLDGLGRSHDQRRITKRGEKTFDIIFKNILAVTQTQAYTDHQCGVTVRINIDKDNAGEVCPLIDLLAERELYKKSVHIDFQGVINWGDKKGGENSLSPDDYAVAEIDWLLYAMKKGFKPSKILPRRTPAPCMVVNPDAEVYDAFGNIYPCYEFPYTPKYERKECRIGHLDEDESSYNPKPLTRGWFEDIKTHISDCPSCNLFPVCGGGCPKKWYSKERGCPSFKFNMEDLLVLDYLINKENYLDKYLEVNELIVNPSS